MSLLAKLTFRSGETLFRATFEALPGAEVTVDDFYVETDETGRQLYVAYLWLVGCEPEQFVTATDDDETVASCRVVTSVDSRHLVQITTTPFPPERPLLAPPLLDSDITLIESRMNERGTHLQVRSPDRDSLEQFLHRVRQIGDEVVLRELYAETPTESDPRKLTDKQRAALALASERGYFEVPRETTLEALATELGVTPQTLSRHIRVGVRKAISPAVEAVDDPHQLFKDTDHEV